MRQMLALQEIKSSVFVWQGSMIFFKALLDNYEADENLPEKTSSIEMTEEDAFINTVVASGGPMEITFKYLQKEGKISLKVKA